MLLDHASDKVIKKYQTATREQLRAKERATIQFFYLSEDNGLVALRY
jgi:hypothetical protein